MTNLTKLKGSLALRVGQLREREVGDRDVIGGGVGAGVARPQHRGEGPEVIPIRSIDRRVL